MKKNYEESLKQDNQEKGIEYPEISASFAIDSIEKLGIKELIDHIISGKILFFIYSITHFINRNRN